MIATPGYERPPESDSDFLARNRDKITAEEARELNKVEDKFNKQATISEAFGFFTSEYWTAKETMRNTKARIAARIRYMIANPESGHSV